MSKKTLLGYLFIGMLLNGGFASCERQEMQNSARIELLDNSWNMNYPSTAGRTGCCHASRLIACH